ncbi:beta-lactamase [Thiohalorhabdus denitrificans]|uniref:Phosphoribosyl 1,2-cyclic phosphate phosphodiesterase n=1 Tax=Thiohalorhabdus denitrificans TaxID=381306 RepID=A0A0N8PMZ9_9GAMM|nr:MBL fold metallo-hydrolase [Thiohalorhabdus denitrificans]KPV40133.1 beta-lactamase [Thiohalorhabdus denitrificans]SCY17192.1 phosphoribosyl 1,2-cyclic phosphate phosphodiesterase [Thiohalorhabdus denitrificans]
MEAVILGSGSSAGTPVIGCRCPVCRSEDPRNHRTRASIWVRGVDGESLLVDTSTDMRHQALREGIDRVDGVFLTHTHADHINGIDDMRAFNGLQEQVIPMYGRPATLEEARQRFHYCFGDPPPPERGWYIPVLEARPLTESLQWGSVTVTPVPVEHGRWPIYGYRFNGLAYLTDVKRIPEEGLALLEGLEVLILDCLRYREHPTHLRVDEAVALAERIGAKRTVFTHFTHDIDFEQLAGELPEGMEPAYDGLRIPISGARA